METGQQGQIPLSGFPMSLFYVETKGWGREIVWANARKKKGEWMVKEALFLKGQTTFQKTKQNKKTSQVY